MIREELKKIWRPGMLVLLLLLGFVFYTIYLSFYIKYFPNSPQFAGEFQVAKEWVQEYGTSLEPEEETEIINVKLPELETEANRYMAQNELCQKYGLTTFADFEKFYDEYVNEVQGDLTEKQQSFYEDAQRIQTYLQWEETNNIEGRLRATQNYTEYYEKWQSGALNMLSDAYDEDAGEREHIHAQNTFIGADAAWQNILPGEVPSATFTYFAFLLVWMVMSDFLLISPLLVRDRMRGMRALQWSSRQGRKILDAQFAAVMLSVLLLTTLNFLIFGGLFATKGTYPFAACRMFSFMDTMLSWVNWTYGTWCIVLIILCYLTSLGFAALTFFLSQYSANYVAMLLKIIPLFAVAASLCYDLILYAFYYSNLISRITGIPGAETILAAFILILGFALCFVACVRQKKQELLDF